MGNAGFYGKNGKNNAATPVSKAILIRDTVKPKITVAGKSAVVQCGKTYMDAGASAADTLDGKLKVTTSSNVDTRKVGKYTVTLLRRRQGRQQGRHQVPLRQGRRHQEARHLPHRRQGRCPPRLLWRQVRRRRR